MSEEAWQPIETAPKDNTPILAHWLSKAIGFPGATDVTRFYDGGWMDEELDRHHGEPDFWMPLPAPPTPKEPHA